MVIPIAAKEEIEERGAQEHISEVGAGEFFVEGVEKFAAPDEGGP